MDALTHGGTPPPLWHYRGDIPLKIYRPGPSSLYELRLQQLAKQIEKLSWMLELMDEEPAINLEGAEYEWQHIHASLIG